MLDGPFRLWDGAHLDLATYRMFPRGRLAIGKKTTIEAIGEYPPDVVSRPNACRATGFMWAREVRAREVSIRTSCCDLPTRATLFCPIEYRAYNGSLYVIN